MEFIALVALGAIGYHLIKNDSKRESDEYTLVNDDSHTNHANHNNFIYRSNVKGHVDRKLMSMAKKKFEAENMMKQKQSESTWSSVTAFDPEMGKLPDMKHIPETKCLGVLTDECQIKMREEMLENMRSKFDSALKPMFKGEAKGNYDSGSQVKLERFSGVPSTEDAGSFPKQRRETINDRPLEKVNIFTLQNPFVRDSIDSKDRMIQSLGSLRYSKNNESVIEQHTEIPSVGMMARVRAKTVDELRGPLNQKEVYSSVVVEGQKGQERAPLPPKAVNKWELFKENTVDDFYQDQSWLRQPTQFGDLQLLETRLMEEYEMEAEDNGPRKGFLGHDGNININAAMNTVNAEVANKDGLLQHRIYNNYDDRMAENKPTALNLPPMFGDYNFKTDKTKETNDVIIQGGAVAGQNPVPLGRTVREKLAAPREYQNDRMKVQIQSAVKSIAPGTDDVDYDTKPEYFKSDAVYQSTKTMGATGYVKQFTNQETNFKELPAEYGDTFRMNPGVERLDSGARMVPVLGSQKRGLNTFSYGLPNAVQLKGQAEIKHVKRKIYGMKPDVDEHQKQNQNYALGNRRSYVGSPIIEPHKSAHTMRNKPQATGRFYV